MKKLWLSIIPARRLSEQPGCGNTPKRCEPPLFCTAIQPALRCWKALDLGHLNMLFQQDWPKEKITAFLSFLLEKLKFFCLTELNDAPLEGLTIILYRSSFGNTAFESG